MINIRNLGSKESVELNLKRIYAPSCAYASALKATGIFVILLSQGGFESDSREKSSKQSFPEFTSEASVCKNVLSKYVLQNSCSKTFLISTENICVRVTF